MPISNLYVVTEAKLIKDAVSKEINGKTLVEVTVAQNPWGKDKDSGRYIAMFVTATFSGGPAQTAATLKKGDTVGFHGSLLCRTYKKKDGEPGVEFEVKYPNGLVKFNRSAGGGDASFDPETDAAPAPGFDGFGVV